MTSAGSPRRRCACTSRPRARSVSAAARTAAVTSGRFGANPVARRGAPLAPGTPPLPVVHHHDRRSGAHVARHADALAGPLLDFHERLVVMVVDARQILEVALAQVRHRPEESPVARLPAEALEPRNERITVIRLDRPDHHAGAVAQLHPHRRYN